MKAVRVTEEWQRAGVHYVRTQAMCLGFKIPLEENFQMTHRKMNIFW